MESRPHGTAVPRRFRMAIERLEPRELPTAPTLLAGPAGVGGDRSSPLTSPIVARLSPTPTPHERVREAFVAKFLGSFLTGPGRFTDQRSQIFIRGGSTSSAFLHGDLQMAIYLPK